MGLPAMDLALTKQPIAMVMKPGRHLEFRKIKLISSKFFIMKPWGLFEFDSDKWSKYDRNSVYFYDVRSGKPFPLAWLKELESFAKKNKLHKIRRKDIRQASFLRKLKAKGMKDDEALAKIKEEEDMAKKNINNTIEEVNAKLAAELGQNTDIDPNEYASVIIDELVGKKLIERHEGFSLKMRMIKGEIDFEDFVKKLEELKTVEINTPISLELEKIIEDYHTYEPAIVDAFIDRCEKVGDKIKKMGTPVVKNITPYLYIFLIIIGAIIAGVAFQNMDFSQVKLPSLNPFAKFILGVFFH